MAGLIAGGIIDRFGPQTALIAGLVLFVIFGTAPVLLDEPVMLLRPGC